MSDVVVSADVVVDVKFSELGLAEPLLRAVTSEGYTVPTPIQAQSIPPILAGRDLLGCAQTGTGKTAAFSLPLLHRLMANAPVRGKKRPIRALVLSPTRELAGQIAESLETYGQHSGLWHSVIFGGVNQFHQVRALQRGVDVLVATPGRLHDLRNQGYIDLSKVEFFVLDEADRMLDMGFLPDVKKVIPLLPTKRQTLFFSATMPPEIRRLADSLLTDPVSIEIAPVRQTTELIEQSVSFVKQNDKVGLLVNLIRNENVFSAIVFTRTKHRADRVVKKLVEAGIKAEALHSNKTQATRQRTLNGFKENKTQILVATDIASRGIDVDSISHIFNFDMPQEAETYMHRIGRTGRAGATGTAISFCSSDERDLLKAVERLTRKQVPKRELPEYLKGQEDAAAPELELPRPPRSNRGQRPAQGAGRRPAERRGAPQSGGGGGAPQGERPRRKFAQPRRPGSGPRPTNGRPPRGSNDGQGPDSSGPSSPRSFTPVV